MKSNTSARAASRVAHALRAVRSVLSDEEKLSMTAFSHTLPDRLMLQVMPSASSARCNCALVSWADSTGRRNTGLCDRL